jgi:glycosyltransferase involved in cell wall biosynthesis
MGIAHAGESFDSAASGPMPSVSVIMLAWNNGPLLRIAAGSILDQTMRELELVLVDNFSTDGSVDRLLAERPDSRIKVIRPPGPASAGAGYTLGAAQSTAPWIAIMDADDVAHPLRLELQLKAAATEPAWDVIGTGAESIDGTGQKLGVWPSFYHPGEIRSYAPFGMPVIHPTLMGRSEIFRRIAYREEFTIGADYDWVLRVLEQDGTIGAVSLPLLQYRRHQGSSTVQRAREAEACTAAIRLCAARRRAGQSERLEEVLADGRRFLAGNTPLSDLHLHFARQCRREGFTVLGALHAALAVREHGGLRARLEFFRALAAAVCQDRGSLGPALGGVVKGPFWILLKRAGFPAFPRY